MTIKEKLTLLDVNTDGHPNIIEDVKKILADAGENAVKVTSKLSINGEKIVEDYVRNNNLSALKKQVNRPKTIKLDSSNNKEESQVVKQNVENVEKKDITQEKEVVKDVVKIKDESGVKKVKITIKKSDAEKTNISPNGRPLPQSTIDEINRRKEEQKKLKEEENKVVVESKEEKVGSDTKVQVENIEQHTQNKVQDSKSQDNKQQVNQPKQNQQKSNNVNNNQNQQNKNKNNNNQKQNNSNNNKQNGNQNNNHQNNNNKQNQNGQKPNVTIKDNSKNKNFQNQQNKNKNNNQNQTQNGQKQNKPFNKDNKNSNYNKDGNRQNGQQGGNKKQGSFQGKNIKTTFNPNNASIAVGTNNRFEGKKKDKTKYAKDFEPKKQTGKNTNTKQDKYKTDINNYENDQIVRKKKKTGAGAFIKPVAKIEKPEDEIKSIVIGEVISIKDLSAKLKMQSSVIVKKLFLAGKMVTPNTELSYEEAENIALEYDILCEKEKKVDVIAELLKEEVIENEVLEDRPPVVCVMGHVDHGKTSILDAIRNTNVIAREAGGITQHIGAYQVKINDRLITFLDTPGHEAFTAMRLRGAKSTDIAVLVVAADDGVKPQTIEAINHAKAANVEIIVAVNKIDKEDANIDRVKQQLAEYELTPTDWGGQTTFCEVSAKKNIGIENLLEMILLTADVMELKANKNRNARGIVIESLLDKGKGPVARVLVQKGTLHVGDFIAMGQSFGKIRAMTDCNGNRVKEALPSTPVEILGINDVPQAGDTFVCFDDEKGARSFAEIFVSENKKKLVEESKHKVTLDALFDQIKAGELKDLNIVLKADVAGSAEAIKNSLEKLSNDEVIVKVIHTGVGNINESDVTLASASNAIIIGFNVKSEPNTKAIIEKEKVDLRLYDIIYNAIDDVEKAMKGMLAPVFEEKIIGQVVVRQIFKASNVGSIAGSYVNDGEVRRNAKVRVKREDKVIFDGPIASLKRFKDEVKDVKAGFECGIVLDGFSEYLVDDLMEIYVMEEKKLSID